jgi:hypothetical protein
MEGKTMKKIYMQPTIMVVKIQHSGIICTSTRTTGLGDTNLNYDPNGGNQGSAWTKESSSTWDEEW